MGSILPNVKKDFEWDKAAEKFIRPFTQVADITFSNIDKKGKIKLRYFFLKPETHMKEAFGFDREILCVYFSYPEIHSRALEQIDDILFEFKSRLDQMVCIFICNSEKVASEIKDFVAHDSERVCFIPFSESFLVEKKPNATDIKLAFQDNMYRRDLFAIESPIQTDRGGFFGRDEIILLFVNRIISNQNSGIFGLRKIGKTSVLYAIRRYMDSKELGKVVYYDCSNPVFYESHWQGCIKILLNEIINQIIVKENLTFDMSKFDDNSAPELFYNVVVELLSEIPGGRLTLALDEIEWISFKTCLKQHWNTEFLPFWQMMRSLHQRTNGAFTFIISGVNPKCVEDESVGGYDNPLFALIKPYYLRPFDEKAVRQMLRTLGKYMGIRFEEDFYSKLIESYGGHPFLVRHACSKISEIITERPITFSKKDFETNKVQVNLSLQKYIKQILNVLAVWYPQEYEMIVLLSKGELKPIKNYLTEKPEFLEHLLGYGLVVNVNNKPQLSLLILSSHLRKAKKEFAEMSSSSEEDIEDIYAEISRKRNKLELILRDFIKTGLRMKYGKKCSDALLRSLPDQRRVLLSTFGYDNIFQNLYFNELIMILSKNWDAFQNWFNRDLKDVELWLKTINEFRVDAHARSINEVDLVFLRVCFRRIEESFSNDQ